MTPPDPNTFPLGFADPAYHAAAHAFINRAGGNLQLIAVPAWTGLPAHLTAAWTVPGDKVKHRDEHIGKRDPETALGILLEHIAANVAYEAGRWRRPDRRRDRAA